MQLAQGHHLNANLALVLPAFGSYRLVPKTYVAGRVCVTINPTHIHGGQSVHDVKSHTHTLQAE